MAAVVSRRARTTQPQSNIQIDWGNPLTAGLVFAYTMGNEAQGWGEDGRNGIQYVKSSDSTITYGRAINTTTGTGGQLLSSGSPYLFGAATQTSVKTSAYSLFAFGTGSGTGMQSPLDDDDGTTRRFQFRLNAGKVELIPFYSGGNGDVIAPAALSAVDLANGFAMGATVNGTACAIYQKGAKTAATLPGAALVPNSSINIGARKTGNTQCWLVGGLQVVAMWNRTLTDGEMQSLADNPWQLFRAQPARRLWLAWSASSGTTTNVNPGAGTLALTGYAPTVAQSANQSVAPGAGALTLTGYAPTVTQSVMTNVSPQAGTLTLTGFTPTVTRTANVNVAPAAGSLTLTGYAPTVTRTTSQTVKPGAGGLTLTGYAPVVSQARVSVYPQLYLATILSQSTLYAVSLLVDALDVDAGQSALQASLAIATIMAESRIYATASLSDAATNQTASFV